MYDKITPARHTLQDKVVESSAKSRRIRRRITKPFTPLPVGYLHENVPLLCQSLFALLWEMAKGDTIQVEYRVLAHKLGRSCSTIERQVRVLKDRGVVAVTGCKVSWCRNGANTFSFPQLTGFVTHETAIENDGEVTKETLNTSTTAQRASAPSSPPVSYAQLRWEHQRSQNQSPALREMFAVVSTVTAENRALRHRFHCSGRDRKHDEAYWLMRAQEGVWKRPAPYVEGIAGAHGLIETGINLPRLKASMSALRERFASVFAEADEFWEAHDDNASGTQQVSVLCDGA